MMDSCVSRRRLHTGMNASSGSLELYTNLSLEAGSSQTRILRLEQRPETQDTAIVNCVLEVADLDDPPDYEALSYCWGDGQDLREICVNGIIIAVSSNLESALRHLRRSSEERLIWADAICINQHDVDERSEQVSRMHSIYQIAKRTVAWLGDDEGYGEQAFKFLEWYAGRKMMIHPSEVDGKHAEYESQGWDAVANLMDRPYWGRLWVMQELALSRGVPKLACGRERLSWILLRAALKDHRMAYYITRLNRVRGAVHDMQLKKTAKKNSVRDGSRLIFLLSHSAAFKTTEPRDRVYGLFGLLRATGIVDFTPDYNLSVAEVYRQITKYVMSMKGGLDVLELKPWDQDETLPSWVVDLSKIPSLQLPFPTKRSWQRASSAESDAPRIESTILEVSGAVIDEVARVDDYDPCVISILGRASQDPDVHRFAGNSLRIPLHSEEFSKFWQHNNHDGHADKLCSRLLDFFAEWEPIVSSLLPDKQEHWYPSSWDLKQMRREAPRCGESDVAAYESFQQRYGEALRPILCRLSLMLRGRRLFRTSRGFLGAGPATVQHGDIVVAFQSTKQLHVLRKLEQNYHYVGAPSLLVSAKSLMGDAAKENADRLPEGTKHEPDDLRQIFKAVKDGEIRDQTFQIQ